MDLRAAVRTCLGKYADLTGRAGRAELWWFSLVTSLVVVGVPVVGAALVSVTGVADTLVGNVTVTTLSMVWALVVMGLVLPSLAVGVRRLHDTGRSGWWCLLVVVPVAGLVLVALWVLPTAPGPNRFGSAGADVPLWPARERG